MENTLIIKNNFIIIYFQYAKRSLYGYCLLTALFGFFLSVPSTYASDFPNSVTFKNFDKSITLNKLDNNQYQIQGSKIVVQLARRLIVKTQKPIPKAQWFITHSGISQVTELYQGDENYYYALELKAVNQLMPILSALLKRAEIHLVQPDILQLKTAAEQGKPGPYKLALQNYYSRIRFQLTPKQVNNKGKGIKIAIIDDGVDLTHPDLAQTQRLFSYDAQKRVLTAAPDKISLISSQLESHGTKVAGVIFAAHNETKINGIASKAQLIALRQVDTWTSNTLLSFQLAKLTQADVINCSWHSLFLLQPIADVVTDLAHTGRNGRGSAVIFAAGNHGREVLPYSTEAAIEAAIVVGAVGANNQRLPFSNYGKTVDLYAYGRSVLTTMPNGHYGLFSGTSLATAIVSGTAALLLADDPDQDIKQLTQKLQKIFINSQ